MRMTPRAPWALFFLVQAFGLLGIQQLLSHICMMGGCPNPGIYPVSATQQLDLLFAGVWVTVFVFANANLSPLLRLLRHAPCSAADWALGALFFALLAFLLSRAGSPDELFVYLVLLAVAWVIGRMLASRIQSAPHAPFPLLVHACLIAAGAGLLGVGWWGLLLVLQFLGATLLLLGLFPLLAKQGP